jgi:signal peptide peptidase SppA
MQRIHELKLSDLISPPANLQEDEDSEFEYGYMSDLHGDVGVLYVNGSLVTEARWFNRYYGMVSYDEIRNAKVELVNRGAKSILGVYRTPGGAASGISSAAEFDMELERQGISSYSFNDSMMMSGGYWLGSSGKKVFTEKMAYSGSIGVITVHVSQKDFLDKMGITATVIRKGEFKALGTPYEKLSEKAREEIEGRMDGIYELFLDHVGDFRKLSRQHLLDTAAEGRVFMGAKAVQVGLADGILTFDKALKYVSDTLPSKAAIAGSALSSHQFITGGNDMKHRILNQAGQSAVASGGIAEAEALKDPKLSDEVSDEPKPEVTDPEVTPEPKAEDPKPEPVVEKPAVADTAMLDRIMDLTAKLTLAENENKSLKDQLSASTTDRQGLRRIAIAAVQRMQIALGAAAGDYDGHQDSALVAQWDKTNTEFHNRFPGVAKARAAADTDVTVKTTAPVEQIGSVQNVGLGAKKHTR